MADSDDIRYALRIPSARPADREVLELDASMAERVVRRSAGRARWRPLLYSWLAILVVVGVGGGILEQLGPLPQRPRPRGGSGGSPAALDPAITAPPFLAGAYVAEPDPPPRPAPAGVATPPPPPAVSRVPTPAAPPTLTPIPAPGQSPGPSPLPAAIPGPTAARPGGGGDKPAPPDPKPADADRKAAEASDRVVVIVHPAGPDDGKAIAQQLATRAGLPPDQVETGEAATQVPRATVRFYAAEDHALARRLGNELGGMGYTWQIENQAGRPAGRRRGVDVFLPRR